MQEGEIMLDKFYEKLSLHSETAVVIVGLAIMLLSGFLMTRITKKLKLPNVTAYIIVGIIIGPFCFDLVSDNVQTGMSFITDIALAFIAFSVGEYFKLSVLKKNGSKVIIITLFEALLASILIFIVMYYICHLDLGFSIVLAALASATAPASTIMTIRQTKAKGDYVDTLLQVVALDDVVSLIAYSVAIAIALAFSSNKVNFSAQTIVFPILKNILSIVIGFVFGFLLKVFLNNRNRSDDNRLIISVAILLAFCGICTSLDTSPLLGCMIMGATYINISNDENLFKQLNYFSPPILLLFFVYSGMNFDLKSLVSNQNSLGSMPLLVVGIIYFFMRIIGKYLGAYLGCVVTKKPEKTRNFLGLSLIPQAGVAIGLAALGARTLGGEIGSDLQTIILASSVLYEMIGPVCSKLGLYLSKSYSTKLEDQVEVETVTENGIKKSNLELLIERINLIQEEIKDKIPKNLDEEAYNKAIKDQEEALTIEFKKKKGGKKTCKTQ